ncbi:hypothetical protein AAHB33_13940 [Paenarthrobacter sp. S56]|uniref:hypothetical protein n=1 Tax=Paenarthrobacter sp. S56 TaxID=3138179 RepID=UPI00321A62E0
MNKIIIQVGRDSVSMGDDMRSHNRRLMVEHGTTLGALIALTAPDIHVPGWAWVALVEGLPRAVWSFDHGVMLLGGDSEIVSNGDAMWVHFRYVSGAEPLWLRERLVDGAVVDWEALEAEYRSARSAARVQEQRRLEAEDPGPHASGRSGAHGHDNPGIVEQPDSAGVFHMTPTDRNDHQKRRRLRVRATGGGLIASVLLAFGGTLLFTMVRTAPGLAPLGITDLALGLCALLITTLAFNAGRQKPDTPQSTGALNLIRVVIYAAAVGGLIATIAGGLTIVPAIGMALLGLLSAFVVDLLAVGILRDIRQQGA